MTRLTAGVLLAGLLGAGLLAAQTAPAQSWTISQAPDALRPTISRANELIAEMQSALLRQLRSKLAQGGPELALGACHIDLALVTQRMGRGMGVQAGFTSSRLRNQANRPKPWAAALVASHSAGRARDVEGFAVDLGDKVGVLRPMVEQPLCANCHGPAENISPAVRKLLAERYPADRAIGFADGEIRGWFWLEMPKPAR